MSVKVSNNNKKVVRATKMFKHIYIYIYIYTGKHLKHTFTLIYTLTIKHTHTHTYTQTHTQTPGLNQQRYNSSTHLKHKKAKDSPVHSMLIRSDCFWCEQVGKCIPKHIRLITCKHSTACTSFLLFCFSSRSLSRSLPPPPITLCGLCVQLDPLQCT